MVFVQNFDSDDGISTVGRDTLYTIKTIAENYIHINPYIEFTMRAVSTDGFYQDGTDGRYIFDLDKKFPDAPMGSYSAVMAKFYIENAKKPLNMSVNCFGPVKIYLNGELVFESQCINEVNSSIGAVFPVKFIEGENIFFIRMRKTPSGFGCIFGAEKDLADPKKYLMPFAERDGIAGFAYCAPSESINEIPQADISERESRYEWYPRIDWNECEKDLFQFERMFGISEGKYAYGITELEASEGMCLKGSCAGETNIYIDDEKLISVQEGTFSVPVSVHDGRHTLTVESRSQADGFGYELNLYTEDDKKTDFCPIYHVYGAKDSWIYAGPFDERKSISLFKDRYSVIDDKYRCLDMPDMNIRPYIDAPKFGRWNYPLGVTLYGLYRAGKLLGREDIIKYSQEHISMCVSCFDYALWDKKTYGYPSVDPKLVNMKMLDDCGSCGSAMLEIYKDTKNESYLRLAERLADFMENKIERLGDGAFYRKQTGVHYMTMWADDLYMSTPFLTRFYEVTGDEKYLRDAARQFLLFKKYLYMKDKRLMSHVYDFKFNTKNYQPWGRGNGWVMFSLTELLEKMPENFDMRGEITEFFREMSEGVLAVQGENGLWHQILTDKNAYEETSCTAMFVYAFSRGARLGLYEDASEYIAAAERGWRGIESRAVDKDGNVYGVCWGSQYSFQAEYYTDKLLTAKNDTHGIGIVMLAGIEFENICNGG